jgi:SHS2 domain-containing protein
VTTPDRNAPSPERRSPAGFEEIDYSGDIGIEAWGDAQTDVIAHATRALMGLMCFSRVAPVVARAIRVDAAAPGDVLVEWLSAVILCAATHGEVYGEVSVAFADDHSAAGVVRGEAVDPARHELRFDVKGATYHALRYERAGGRWSARVILDL